MNEPADPVALGLPHRDPFIFIDEVLEQAPGEYALGRKRFTPEDPVFHGHFPGDPLVPGVLLVEALAQTAGIAAAQAGQPLLLSAIRAMKFVAPVRPGDEILLHARKVGAVGSMWQFDVRAEVFGRTVAEGTLVLATPRV